MLNYQFMQNAFIVGTLIAILSGIIGVFVIARNMTFLTHILSETGFAGAAFGLFMGWNPLWGMVLFTLLSSIFIGQLSNSTERNDDSITAVSSLAIGSGILFLFLANSNSSSATNILFGSIVGIDKKAILNMIGLILVVIVLVSLIYRKLKFDSFDPIGAKSRHLPVALIALFFQIALALSVSVSAQIIGSLLIFILLTLPAASAKNFAHNVKYMIGLAISFSLAGVWLGLWLSYKTNWPVSFFISLIEVLIYFVGIIYQKRMN